jgi:hypothetical protein
MIFFLVITIRPIYLSVVLSVDIAVNDSLLPTVAFLSSNVVIVVAGSFDGVGRLRHMSPSSS